MTFRKDTGSLTIYCETQEVANRLVPSSGTGGNGNYYSVTTTVTVDPTKFN